MAETVIMWSAAVAMAALAAALVAVVLFVVSAGISGVREARRKKREADAARDLITRAFTSTRSRRRG